MRLRFSDLWRWDGTVDRVPYGAAGSLLFLAKYAIDTAVVRATSARPWSPVHYWIPGDLLGWRSLKGIGGEVYAILLLCALPFIWPGIRPPHLDGHFLSRRGQFLLEPLPGGRTRLEGTTWYEHRLWPNRYWGLWSDPIIHSIHARVLRHVKRLSEGGR